jgi:hypothetical protein
LESLFFFEYIYKSMSSSTRRQQERDNEYSSNTQQQRQQQQQQHEATIRSIDMTKEGIRRSIEEIRREMPRYSQTVTDFQNETADATREIADNFLDSQKEVINSMQSAWAPMTERIGGRVQGNYWTTGMIGVPFFSPREMADVYARTIGAMAEAYVASSQMATNMVFAGIEAAIATTNYTRQNAKEAARITSNTARTFAQTAKETIQVEYERGISVWGSSSSFGAGGEAGSAPSSSESREGAAATRTSYTSEGTVASSSGTGSTTAGMGAATETITGVTEKTRKK